MSKFRQLLGLNFLRREPWRFPEPQLTRSGGVSIGNTRVLRREIAPKDITFVVDKEVISGISPRGTKGVNEVGEQIPLHVKLRENTDTKIIVSRKRSLTRLGISGAGLATLNNVMFLNGAINSEQALSIGYAAVELNINYLRVRAPRGRGAIEQLRVLKTITARFNLRLIIAVSTSDDLDLCLNWADRIEIEILKDGEKKDLIRRVFSSDKSLALRRGENLAFEEFIRMTSWAQLESPKPLIIFESGAKTFVQGSIPTFCVGLIQRIKEKTGSEIILDLTDKSKNGPLGVLLSGVTSGANGLALYFEHTQATESFEELQSTTQKLGAIKYTLNAVNQIN